jgi:hypothetical protein
MADPHNVARDALCDSAAEAIAEADPYVNEVFDAPAKTVAGRQAKLRILKSWLCCDYFKTQPWPAGRRLRSAARSPRRDVTSLLRALP